MPEHQHERVNDEGTEDYVRVFKGDDGKFYGDVVAARGNLPDEDVETLQQGYDNKGDLLAVVAKRHPALKSKDETKGE